MRRTGWISVLLALLAAGPPAAAAPASQGTADAKAVAIVRELTDAMGGQTAWDALPYLRFDFVVLRNGREVARFRHWWDKKLGRCRVEGPDEKGRVVTALFKLSDRSGKSFTDGIADTDSANIASILQMGYERWVNDTYWLMMPFKLRDPGTRLQYSGAKRGDGAVEWDVLELTFDPGVGLTPKDHYWLYVNRKTHLIDRWEFVLQDQKGPRQGSTWEGWTRVGPVQLSTLRRIQGKSAVLRIDHALAPASMDESIFSDAHPKE